MPDTATATDAREGATTEPADLWHTITTAARNFLDHERWKVWLPVIVCGAFVAVILAGCQATATVDGVEVTPETINTVYEGKATALQQEYAAWVAQGEKIKIKAAYLDADYDSAYDSLAAQVAERNKWIESLGGIGLTAIDGTLNPASAAGSLLTLLIGSVAVGAAVDNRRKNKVIDRLKTNGTGA